MLQLRKSPSLFISIFNSLLFLEPNPRQYFKIDFTVHRHQTLAIFVLWIIKHAFHNELEILKFIFHHTSTIVSHSAGEIWSTSNNDVIEIDFNLQSSAMRHWAMDVPRFIVVNNKCVVILDTVSCLHLFTHQSRLRIPLEHAENAIREIGSDLREANQKNNYRSVLQIDFISQHDEREVIWVAWRRLY